MQQGKPSVTARWVAAMRVAHQERDASPHVLEDPIAARLLADVREAEHEAEAHHLANSSPLRAFVVARSRYTEDMLARAVLRGVRQYVILGAGLDTFAYRNPHPHLRVIEVDHPATQAWKRERLAAAGITPPPSVTFAPVDFSVQSLPEGLAALGFDRSEATFFSWLGVTPYITLESFRATLAAIAALPRGSGVAFDYMLAREELTDSQRRLVHQLTLGVVSLGEPFQLFFRPPALAAELTRAGFSDVEDLDEAALTDRYFLRRADTLRPRDSTGRLVSAWVRGTA
jgi:methyltransferase (TIGR00027 family)